MTKSNYKLFVSSTYSKSPKHARDAHQGLLTAHRFWLRSRRGQNSTQAMEMLLEGCLERTRNADLGEEFLFRCDLPQQKSATWNTAMRLWLQTRRYWSALLRLIVTFAASVFRRESTEEVSFTVQQPVRAEPDARHALAASTLKLLSAEAWAKAASRYAECHAQSNDEAIIVCIVPEVWGSRPPSLFRLPRTARLAGGHSVVHLPENQALHVARLLKYYGALTSTVSVGQCLEKSAAPDGARVLRIWDELNWGGNNGDRRLRGLISRSWHASWPFEDAARARRPALSWSIGDHDLFVLERLFTYPEALVSRYERPFGALGGLTQCLIEAWSLFFDAWTTRGNYPIRVTSSNRRNGIRLALSVAFAEWYGIEVCESRRGSRAFLVQTGKDRVIYVDAKKNRDEIAAAVLHELSHYLLRHPHNRMWRDKDRIPQASQQAFIKKEREADALASVFQHLLEGLADLCMNLASRRISKGLAS